MQGKNRICVDIRHNLETADKAGATVEQLLAMGGAASSKFWTQIKADITGKVIKVPASDTATTMGAVILAGVGTGVFRSFEQAVNKLIEVKRVHTPNPENKAVYDKNYATYLKLYPALKNIKSTGDV